MVALSEFDSTRREIPGSERRILVVDDHPDTADVLAALLGLDGHQVRAAIDGETALEIAETFAPEIVILDLGLPGISGAAVADGLRRSSVRPRLVALTGRSAAEVARSGAVFDRVVSKPIVDHDGFRRLVRELAAEPSQEPPRSRP